METNTIICGDCLEVMAGMPDNSVDLVITSPPYEDARTYGIDFKLRGQGWIDWCMPRFIECLRVCRGLVAWVIEGRTRKFRWSATPALFMADLHRAGVHLRKPPIYLRQGIPGSGGPDWWRNDYEFILCATKGGKLPWSENIATGWKCKYPTGGELSNRTKDGKRLNISKGYNNESKTGDRHRRKARPAITNPGNVIKGPVGKGHMGNDLAHETEAPFPEWLVKPFVLCFCPPGGIVLDPFSGSGTTAAVALQNSRHYIAIDIRQNQIDLGNTRLKGITVKESEKGQKVLF